MSACMNESVNVLLHVVSHLLRCLVQLISKVLALAFEYLPGFPYFLVLLHCKNLTHVSYSCTYLGGRPESA